MEFKFDVKKNSKKIDKLKKVITENKNKKGPLMPILHQAQKIFGYLPIEIQKIISEELDIPLAEVYGVATFYAQFSLIPKGKYTIGVCLGTACYVKGAQDIVDRIKEQLDLEVGGTTKDRKFSLQATRCIGACGLAPVMTVNEDVYGKLNPEEVPDIINKYK
ncbi:MAG: NAD(P)H-dependent oxidoreductase subunit E [Firmicutes bacterium]|nr:NAD(P)H-dependent oxidoreductase subunit E [Bacillota bacterium]